MSPLHYVILHNVRSAHNVGAIFRTADAAGVNKIFLTGYTPAPIDRFGRGRKDIAKTALGAENTVPWESVAGIHDIIARLRRDGVCVVAVEQDSRAIPCGEWRAPERTALIFGNEVDGLPEDVLADADEIIYLPMRGKKESLNVAVAAGVALYHATNM